MTTEHQPGSPVDIAEFEAHGGSWSRNRLLDTAVLAVTELRTLRARVGELEAEADDWNSEANAAIDASTKRAESAEARIAELEKLFDDAGQGEHNVLALIDHYQSEAMAESERSREAEARVKELEAWVRDLESDARADAEMLHKRDDRIAELESQLASCTNELDEARVKIDLLLQPIPSDSTDPTEATKSAAHILLQHWTANYTVEKQAHRKHVGDLESQLAAAREEQAQLRACGATYEELVQLREDSCLEAKVREVLGPRWFELLMSRAILECEAKRG